MTVALRLLMYINTTIEDDQTIPNSSTLPAFSSVLSINTLIKHIESNGSRPSPLHQFQVRTLSTHGLRGAPPSNHRRLHKRHQTIDVHTTKVRKNQLSVIFFSFSSFFSVIFRTIELDVPKRIELRDVDLRPTVLHQNEPFDLLIKPTYIYFDSEDIGLKPPQGFDRRSSRPASSAQRKSQDEQAAQDLSTPSFSPSFLTSHIPPSSRTLTHNTYKRQRSFDSSNSSDSFKRQHS